MDHQITAEQRQTYIDRAVAFSHRWKDIPGDEEQETQGFLINFFKIWELDITSKSPFERRVKLTDGSRGRIDCLLDGVILVEQKSAGINLDSAYQQALDYIPGLKPESVPRYVMTCDFRKFRLYDESRYSQPKETRIEFVEFTLDKLSEHIDAFNFIVGAYTELRKEQESINVIAANKLGRVHNLLEKEGYTGHQLELLMVRILFCLFAEDTGILADRAFTRYLEEATTELKPDIGPHLAKLFEILDTKEDDRPESLEKEQPELFIMPYVNGELFQDRDYTKMPYFNREMRAAVLDAADLDWNSISPDIFGSLFQSIKDKEDRRQGGEHYTSETNIRKCLDPLFLDDLRKELDGIQSKHKLEAFHEKLGKIRILDPACGCGNFLVVSYRELRRLEHEVLKKLQKQGMQILDVALLIKVNVESFYGIEIEDWPSQIAQSSLWLTEIQMNRELGKSLGKSYVRLPLSETRTIKNVNALELDWGEVVGGISTLSYIVGNPPFVGHQYQSNKQKEEILNIMGSSIRTAKSLDYVSCWFVKALEVMKENPGIKTAFVSTSGITHGEQVEPLWGHMIKEGIHIQFAHRTFLWNSEAKGKAGVCCVVIGMGMIPGEKPVIYDYENPKDENPISREVKNINPYLIDSRNVIVGSASKSLNGRLNCIKGSMPTDGGYLSKISKEEKDDWLEKEPFMEPYLRKLIGGHEFLNNKERYCLWLKDADPAIWSKSKIAKERIENVRRMRLNSAKSNTRELAKIAYLFEYTPQKEDLNYLMIPRVTSGDRRYVPMGFIDAAVICNDSVQMVPGAGLYELGILHSLMHMSWMRVTCGRTAANNYRYSGSLVYNTFIWPDVTEDKNKEVEELAQIILDVREKYSTTTLAILYNPESMPVDLTKAHNKLDKAVDRLYSKKSFTSEMDRVGLLFELYEKSVKPIN